MGKKYKEKICFVQGTPAEAKIPNTIGLPKI